MSRRQSERQRQKRTGSDEADDLENKMEADLKNIHQLEENREKHIYASFLNLEALMKEHTQTCANNINKLKEELADELKKELADEFKKERNELKKERNELKKELADEFKKERNEFKKERNELKKELADEFQKERNEFKKERNEFKKELNEFKKELVNELLPIIKTSIREGIRDELQAALPTKMKELLKNATISLEIPT